MKIIIIAIVYSITIIVSPLIGMDQSGAPSKNRYLQKPNRYMNPDRVNPLLKPAAKQNLPAQNSTLPQPALSALSKQPSASEVQDTAPKSPEEMEQWINTEMVRLMSDNSSAEERATFLRQLEDFKRIQANEIEQETLARKAANVHAMAAIDAYCKKEKEIEDAKLAKLDAQLAAQKIQHAKEREEQRIELEKVDAELAAKDVAFKQRMAVLRAQLP